MCIDGHVDEPTELARVHNTWQKSTEVLILMEGLQCPWEVSELGRQQTQLDWLF